MFTLLALNYIVFNLNFLLLTKLFLKNYHMLLWTDFNVIDASEVVDVSDYFGVVNVVDSVDITDVGVVVVC